MRSSPIYTTEPMATRALAAEIRHDSSLFVELLRERTGIASIAGVPEVRCEGSGLVDIELVFTAGPHSIRIGIEAKFDHELTEAQANKQLEKLAEHGTNVHSVLLIPALEDAPSWVNKRDDVSAITWAETVKCFREPRLTEDDIQAIPLQQRQVERALKRLDLFRSPPQGWTVTCKRTGSGMPALLLESRPVLGGRELRGQLQVAGRPMPTDPQDVRFEYFLGVEIVDPTHDLPDAEKTEIPPVWLESLIGLRDRVIGAEPSRYLVNTGKPGAGRSIHGHRKVGLVRKFAPDSTWLAKGYADWALGIKSKPVSSDQLEELANVLSRLAGSWLEVEADRLATSNTKGASRATRSKLRAARP